MHLHRREIGQNICRIFQLDPVILDVLTRGEMAITPVIFARDRGKHMHLLAAERAIGNGHAQHIGMELKIEAIHQPQRSEEHTSELQSLMRISYAVFCLKKKTIKKRTKEKQST